MTLPFEQAAIGEHSGAYFGRGAGPESLYRYRLWRRWSEGGRICAFLMLNPSTADASQDDPTIRRCIGYAKRWGFDALEIVNLFALRSTDPQELYRAVRRKQDPVGVENDAAIDGAVRFCELTICAWGNHGDLQDRAFAVVMGLNASGLAPKLRALRINAASLQPSHPLYLPGALQPQPLGPLGIRATSRGRK